MAGKKLTGRIAADRIRMQSTPKPPAGAVERFLALGECTSLISDVMDELGMPEGVIGASTLKPTLPGKLICGPALTVRNITQRVDPFAAAREERQRHGRVRGAQPRRGRRRAGDLGRPRHVEHGRHLGAHRPAPGRARRHRHGRRARRRAFALDRLSGLGERDHAGHRQVAARDGRDQRRNPDGRGAGQRRRPGGGRRHRRGVHPARPTS